MIKIVTMMMTITLNKEMDDIFGCLLVGPNDKALLM
jgi:hypothetical protein